MHSKPGSDRLRRSANSFSPGGRTTRRPSSRRGSGSPAPMWRSRRLAPSTGLFRLMRELGLTADMFAGHSYGEFVALHAAGAIDFEALMQLSAARGRFIIDAAGAAGAELGTMADVNAARERV